GKVRICRNKGGNYVQAYPTTYRWLRTIRSCDPKRNTFAKSINAEVTGFHVILPFHIFTLQMERLGDTKEEYERQSKGQAEQFLGVIKKAAEKAGVSCDTDYVTSSHPYEMI